MSSLDKQLTVTYKVKGGNVMNDVFKPMFIFLTPLLTGCNELHMNDDYGIATHKSIPLDFIKNGVFTCNILCV
jgi:hypothetical protein